MKWQGNTKLHLAVCGLLSALGGSAVTFVVANKILEEKFQQKLGDEILDAKAYYQEMYSQPILVEDPRKDEEDLLEAVREATDEADPMPVPMVDRVAQALTAARSYEGGDTEDERPALVIQNIFQATPPGDAVVEALMVDRDISKPYIITKEEYYQNEPDHEQVAFTFWEEDDVLVDDRYEYQPIEHVDLLAGEDNLLHFGYGSEDENTVYIRNESIDPPMDLYVTRSAGKYADEVMGLNEDEPHIAHSQRRFKIYDE